MWISEGVGWLTLLLYYASLAVRVVALVDALTRPAEAFVAAGKLTKVAWVVILAVAVGITFFSPTPWGIFGIAALVAAIVYLVDVRPAVRQITGRRPPRRSSEPW